MAGGEGAFTGNTVGAYQVRELIGTGQLAEVYRAWHLGQPQPVALKIFAPSVAANIAYVEVLREMAARASLLDAPHILRVNDFVHEGKLLYLAMPLMHESLRAVLLRSGVLPLYRAVPLLRQIASGLGAAHVAGIIHRDLKPENVLLDTEGRAFVSDFGIGRDLTPERVEHRSLGTLSSLIGTPAYMAPEQLRGQLADQRTDVYALGVIFYEMLTGAPPYSGKTIYEVAAKALTTPIVPPTRRTSGVTPLLERAMLRALTRDPAARWPTVQRFIVGLDAALPTRFDALADPAGTGDQPRRTFVTPLLAPMGADIPPVAAVEAVTDNASLSNILAQDGSVYEDERSGSSGSVVVPDLRLFKVDPLPPMPPRRHVGLLLLGIACLMLLILGAGGVLLVNAAQPSHNNAGATPTNLPATRFIITPMSTTIPTVKPTNPPAPKPTATHQPVPTATSKPTATATSIPPTATPISSVSPGQ